MKYVMLIYETPADFEAPFVTNEDIGAVPDLADPSSLRLPFIDRQGIAEQSYIIQMLGEAETAHDLRARRSAAGRPLCLSGRALHSARDAVTTSRHMS